jgi:hypothetical protein
VPQDTLVYKGPTMIPIDPFDFFPHPQMVNIHDDLPAIHRFYATRNHLKDMERQGFYRNVDFIDWKHEGKLSEPELDERKKERRNLAGVKETQEEKDAVECYEWQGMYDLDGTGERVNAILVVTADNIVLRAEELPYYDKKKTYEYMKIFPIQGEFYGQGLIEKQHAIESELVNRSGQFVHVDRGQGENLQTDFLYRMQPEMIAPDAYNILNMIKGYAQSVSLAQAPATGDLPGSKQTATAVSTAFGQSCAVVCSESISSLSMRLTRYVLSDRAVHTGKRSVLPTLPVRLILYHLVQVVRLTKP